MTPEVSERQAEMLGNRLRATYRRLRRVFERQEVGAFRLYDQDIPEIRLLVDWYEGHVVVAELERWQTAGDPRWLERMGDAVTQALSLPAGHLHLKRRRTRPVQGPRYQRLCAQGTELVVREGALRFLVRLDEHIDTGLFADQRRTRALVADAVAGLRFLNLFGYTGSFTCAAALGGARTTTTVDLSAAYLAWAGENLALCGYAPTAHERVAADVPSFLESVRRAGRRWDIAVCDPPSFSTVGGPRGGFDVNRDHPWLLEQVLGVIEPGGILFFSTNHQHFTPRCSGLPLREVAEITHLTVPREYRNRHVHRAFRIET
ncbi:MAG: class I SAM-dependent methyltransferase [Polyangiaceae bacterium]|nr:class I SAM-dependent methyltransferase [Polyangiaceae bacterium]